MYCTVLQYAINVLRCITIVLHLLLTSLVARYAFLQCVRLFKQPVRKINRLNAVVRVIVSKFVKIQSF